MFFMKTLIALTMAAAPFAAAGDPLKKYNLDHGVALRGFDPVSYFSPGGPVPGNQAVRFTRDGVTYLFKDAADRDAFTKEPERYEPAYGGWCAYAMAGGDFVDVDPKTFKIVDHKLLLFYNGWLGNTLTKWNKAEPKLRTEADASWQKFFGSPSSGSAPTGVAK